MELISLYAPPPATDARRGDRSAAQFLQYFCAHRRNLQQFQKQEIL